MESAAAQLCAPGRLSITVGLGLPADPGPKRLRVLIERDTAQAITQVWHFGQLFGNTDMHDGNLSFRPWISAAHRALSLAPIYDMLPMLYAPQRGVELAPVAFAPRPPLPTEGEAWQQAAAAADQFWSRAADDARLIARFRAICVENLRTVRKTVGLPGGGADSAST
jgi:hypothetical protein